MATYQYSKLLFSSVFCLPRYPVIPTTPCPHRMPRLTIQLLGTLCLILLPAHSALAQVGAPDTTQPRSSTHDAHPSREGGWDGLARLLDALKPGVDTALAPAPSEITEGIQRLLDQGQNQQALTLIKNRLEAEKDRHMPGTDVQLAFLHARALAATGDRAGAEQLYRELSTRYPELPEPWNNLAALYLQSNQLERALHALQTAILIDPQYGEAYANLANVQLRLARQTYETAARLNVPGARQRSNAIGTLLEQP